MLIVSYFSNFDNEDSVTFQTIHKSKGLEYPVVIMYNSSKLFSYLTEHDGINFDADLGFGVDYFDTSERIKDTFYFAVDKTIKHDIPDNKGFYLFEIINTFLYYSITQN